MIKETELRIGNILLLDNTKIIRLLWVKNNKCCVMQVGVIYPSAIVDIERLQPIELTEEILLKCGFKKGFEGGTLWYLDNFFVASLDFIYWSDIKIKHLHQLQNIYFALSKKELEINM